MMPKALCQLLLFILSFNVCNDWYIISVMSQRKPWSEEQDQQLRQLVGRQPTEKLKWGEIANLLKKEGNVRTGKQCRQRWHNQLKPGIDNDKEWSEEEEQVLFRAQEELGNKWALIARELPGRTDNNIKNYFYSTLRKALRKVNAYVYLHKRSSYRNVKEFNQQNLNKIIIVSEKKYQNKINLRADSAEEDAREIKKLLVQIQRDDGIVPTAEEHPLLKYLVDKILQFNRICKRRKGKRRDSDREEAEEDSEENSEVSVVSKKKKKMSKVVIKQSKPEVFEKRTTDILESSKNLSANSQLKKKSSSSLLKDSSGFNRSSSFKEYPHLGSNQNSNFANNNLFESRYSMGNPIGTDRDNVFWSGIPNLQRKQTNRSNLVLDLWRQDPNIHNNNLNFLEWSHNFMKQDDNNPLRKSLTLDNSLFFNRRTSSRLEKRNSDKQAN